MYKVNKSDVMEADAAFSYVERKGKYVGFFTKAKHFEARSGTTGVQFDFISNSGEQASFTLWTKKADGSFIYGHKQLQAIMACLRIRELGRAVPAKAREYDREQGRVVEVDVPQFVQLINKPIGLLLVMEEYLKNNGASACKAAFAHAFEAATELTASEIMEDSKEPVRLPLLVQSLKDKPLKNKSTAVPFGTNNGGFSEINPPPADLNDDIPF